MATTPLRVANATVWYNLQHICLYQEHTTTVVLNLSLYGVLFQIISNQTPYINNQHALLIYF